MKHQHQSYIDLVTTGPPGLFSRGDTARLADHVADGIAGATEIARIAGDDLDIVDIGSGGGVPGIPTAIELPGCRLHLVESLGWKATFLRDCAATLDLESRLQVHGARAEEMEAVLGRELMDVGTARAVAAPIVVAEYLAPLVRPGGHLMLWSTAAQASDASVRAQPELGLGPPQVLEMPSPLRSDGVLLLWPRVAPCAPRFPRRTGVAAKRPLA